MVDATVSRAYGAIMTSLKVFAGFVQYARLNEELVVDLLKRLAPRINGDVVGVDWWRDRQATIGDLYSPEIIDRITSADVVLQCLSPDFFAKGDPTINGYIWDHEMPVVDLRGSGVVRAPVGLVEFGSSHGRARRLEWRTYHLLGDGRGGSHFYADLDANGRNKFALTLADRILERIAPREAS